MSPVPTNGGRVKFLKRDRARKICRSGLILNSRRCSGHCDRRDLDVRCAGQDIGRAKNALVKQYKKLFDLEEVDRPLPTTRWSQSRRKRSNARPAPAGCADRRGDPARHDVRPARPGPTVEIASTRTSSRAARIRCASCRQGEGAAGDAARVAAGPPIALIIGDCQPRASKIVASQQQLPRNATCCG